MPEAKFSKSFTKKVKALKHNTKKEQIVKIVAKIKKNPKIGKPMRYTRKNTLELYLGSFRISYIYKNDVVLFLNLYHKDIQ